MNKEIEKILKDLELCNGVFDFIIESDDSKLLIDYIKSLQQENQELKKQYEKVLNDYCRLDAYNKTQQKERR